MKTCFLLTALFLSLTHSPASLAAKFTKYGDYECSVRCQITYGGYSPNTVNEYLRASFRVQAAVFANLQGYQQIEYINSRAESQAQSSCQEFCRASWDAKSCRTYANGCHLVGGE